MASRCPPHAAQGLCRHSDWPPSRGIRVNAVSPGGIQTPILAPETYHAILGNNPLGRVGQVSDIVDGILFLESSPFITGEILHIDGGQIAGH
jgi:NAD(P)-dependent dehydrogenase (short-subunit alcohol dehydrogenase family)